MAKYAISQEGADAMRQLANDLISAKDGLNQASIKLQSSIVDCMDGLGFLGIEIWDMSIKVKDILASKEDVINELAEKANQKSSEISEMLGLLGGGISNGCVNSNDFSKRTIGGKMPGSAMSFEAADSGNVNPNYGKDIGFDINCQSCVATFEARLRGYDVQVLPNTHGSMLETLSHKTNLVWIDPSTGNPPEYVFDNSLSTPEEYVDFIDRTVEQGNRYTIQFLWKGRKSGGHIVNLDRNEFGELRIKDNQRGMWEQSEWLGISGIKEYLNDVEINKNCVPQILRIDNMQFNYDVANQIME